MPASWNAARSLTTACFLPVLAESRLADSEMVSDTDRMERLIRLRKTALMATPPSHDSGDGELRWGALLLLRSEVYDCWTDVVAVRDVCIAGVPEALLATMTSELHLHEGTDDVENPDVDQVDVRMQPNAPCAVASIALQMIS